LDQYADGLSRATERLINESIDGAEVTFADDLNTLALDEMALENQIRSQRIIRDTFNKNAISMKKSVPPTKRTDVIGWSLDLMKDTFGPNKKGRDK
jgi:hypothetical protein